MAGMARATGATLMGAQKFLGKNQNLCLAVFSTSILRPIRQRLTTQLHRYSALSQCNDAVTLACLIYKTSSSRCRKG